MQILDGVLGHDFDGILAAAQQGDEAAFARLWRDVNPALMQYLRVFAGEVAEDVAADTWVQVVRRLEDFEGTEVGWRAWVFTTARRRAIDEGRRRARRSAAVAAAQHAHEAGHPDVRTGADQSGVADTADLALEHLQTKRVMALIAQLPRKQAEVVVLRTVAGLPVEEVARILRCSPGAVRVNAHRGLRRLAELLTPEGVTPGAAETLRTTR
jgi:RNA polymerase sigma-70 factor (ECF subfamily)